MSLSAPPAHTSVNDDERAAASSFPFDHNLDVLKHVLSFVGSNQYRFIVGVNRCFQEAHIEAFPENKRTYLKASTENLAGFCWDEIDKSPTGSRHQEALCPRPNMVTYHHYSIYARSIADGMKIRV